VVLSQPPKSVKEARKLLGKDFAALTNEQIEEMVLLLDVIAVDFVLATVPN
jgi:hypothetical protein